MAKVQVWPAGISAEFDLQPSAAFELFKHTFPGKHGRRVPFEYVPHRLPIHNASSSKNK
jgi:hypothetical protein